MGSTISLDYPFQILDKMIGMNSNEDLCIDDKGQEFIYIQYLFRAYFTTFTYLFGIIANSINIIVFSQKTMRNQPVNWFFLALSISDLAVLMSSFFVFSMPVYVESDPSWSRLSVSLLVWFYPVAQTGLTMSVYLTLLVSVHRYLGVCHPFLIRRISNSSAVKGVIASAVAFAFLFNITRWFEIRSAELCTGSNAIIAAPTSLMMNQAYIFVYRNCLYSLVMFFLPFSVLSFVNFRIINTLRNSYKMRRQMTVHGMKEKRHGFATQKELSVNQSTSMDSPKPVAVNQTSDGAVETKTLKLPRLSMTNHHQTAQFTGSACSNSTIERKDHGVTIMLVGLTTEFLVFNVLAFAMNCIELATDQTSDPTYLFTLMLEVSTLLVNINGASTIVIYLAFGSKYRAVFCRLFKTYCGLAKANLRKKQLMFTATANLGEMTQLVNENNRNDEFKSQSSTKSTKCKPYREHRNVSIRPSNGNCERMPILNDCA